MTEFEAKTPNPDTTEQATEAVAEKLEAATEAPAAPAVTDTEVAAEAATDGEAVAAAEAPAEAADAAPGAVESMPDAEDFAQAMVVPKHGDVLTGKVVQISGDSVMVDVGYKSEGVVPLNELSHRPLASAEGVVQVGDDIEVYVTSVDAEGNLRLSKRRADEAAAMDKVKEAYDAGEILEAEVVEVVKGGLVLDIGMRGFMPASQVERGYVADLGKYLGQKLRARIIELDQQKNRVILSQKQVLEEEREQARGKIWAEIEVGQTRAGVVKSLTDFGAFVDLGGVDGLVHISELSWGRPKHPSEVLDVGDEINVQVLRLDHEKGKVSLGYKQTLADPWTQVEEKYPEGTVVAGRVVRLTTFGAFVELEPGVDGLIHISQLADHRVIKPDEIVNPGEEVRVRVLSVRPEEKRISLSLREADQETDL